MTTTLRLMAIAAASLLAAACGGGGSDGTEAARELPLDRLYVGAPARGYEMVTVKPEADADNGPYTVSTSDANCATAQVVGLKTIKVTGGNGAAKCSLSIQSAGGSTIQIPIAVYDPFIFDTDELSFAYTNQFEEVVVLGRSPVSGTLYNPIRPPDPRTGLATGFMTFGAVLVLPGDSIDNHAVFIVRGKTPTAVKPTLQFDRLYKSSSFGGFAIFRPKCTPGYVALGLTAMKWDAETTAEPPVPTEPIACVRHDLVVLATNQFRFGASMGYWYTVEVQGSTVPHEEAYLGPDTFNWGMLPGEEQPAYSFAVRVPVLADVPVRAWQPKLISNLCPPAFYETRPVLTRRLLVPFTQVKDDALAGYGAGRIGISPFYILERYSTFQMVACRYNDTGINQPASFAYETGVETTVTDAFTHETNIEISVGGGIGELDTSAKWSVTLGYSHSVAVTELTHVTGTFNFDAIPKATTAIFQERNIINLYRFDKDHMVLHTSSPGMNGLSFVVTQYPPVP